MATKVTKIESLETGLQQYDQKDVNLINSIKLQRKFGLPEDYIEQHVYDLNNQLLKSNYKYQGYSNINSLTDQLELDPAADVKVLGFDQGSVKTTYNILRKLFGDNKFFIKRNWI